MKKSLCLLLCVAFSIGFVACAPTAPAPEKPIPAPAETPATSAQETPFVPGDYTIDTQGLNGPMQVVITMSESGITGITVPAHKETIGIGDIAIALISARILEAQSLKVDAVSGATFTGSVLLHAVNEALAQAGGSANDLVAADIADTRTLPADGTADVVVIGAGAAGMAAALRAKELGLQVILLEKQDIVGGTSVMAGIGTQGAGSKLQLAKPDPFLPEEFFEYLKAIGVGVEEKIKTVAPIREDLAYTLAYKSGAMIDWLGEIGLKMQTGDHSHSHGPASTEGGLFGEQLVRSLSQQLEKSQIDLRCANKAVNLIIKDGVVTGVEVETAQGNYKISAEAVVICTGSYAGSADVLGKFAPSRQGGYTSTSAVANTGDGLVLASSAGAALVNLDAITFRTIAYGANSMGGAIGLHDAPNAGAILVNAQGKRFVNENGSGQDIVQAIQSQTDGSAYVIMDQTAMDKRFDIAVLYIPGTYETIFTKADTIEDLAKAIDMDVAVLTETIATYTGYVGTGVDEEFGRTSEKMLSDMTTGPFYACKGRPSNHICAGGILIDGRARVLSEGSEEPIPGLYAAGETVNLGYHPVLNALTMGREAAEAIKEIIG